MIVSDTSRNTIDKFRISLLSLFGAAMSGPSCSILTMALVKRIIKTLIIKYDLYVNIFAEKM